MADERILEQAKVVYETLCQTLDDEELSYNKLEEQLVVECKVRGDDLPISIIFMVDAEKAVIRLYSRFPFSIQEDQRLDAAIAITAVNYRLVDGCFDYDIASGDIIFRTTNSFLERSISKALILHMFLCVCHVVDEYNDKFFMLSKGILSVEQFLNSMDEE